MRSVYLLLIGLLAVPTIARAESEARSVRHLLYVAEPGIRNDLQYGGHGLLVYDCDNDYKLLRRIPTGGVGPNGKPINVKGICANATTGRLYISTITTLECFDLLTEKSLWEKTIDMGCDRMSMTPDGKTMFLPSFEANHWKVMEALTGDVLARIVTNSGSHNTVVGPDGAHAYLAGLHSPLLTVASSRDFKIEKTVGPFSAEIRPFTVNGKQTLCFVNVNKLLGFEVGDITSGKKLARVEVQGFETGKTLRHGCPSHGIAMTPDEKEIWLADGHNRRVHIFDASVMPPKQLQSIELSDEPGWITFSIDGRMAYPSTGDVVDTKTRTIVNKLKDENGQGVQSEKLLEIDFVGDKPVRAGDQFGVGQVQN